MDQEKKKGKIYFLIPYDRGGGVEVVFSHLYRQLSNWDYDCEFVIGEDNTKIIPAEWNKTFLLPSGKKIKGFMFVFRFFQLWKFFRRQRDCTIISGMEPANFVNSLLKLVIPTLNVISTVHGNPIVVCEKTRPNFLFRFFNLKILPRLYNRNNCVVCVSDGVRRSLSKLRVKDSVLRTIYNPIFSEMTPADRTTSASSPHSNAEPEDGEAPVSLLAVGRLSFQKNFEFLLRTVHLLKEAHERSFILRIVGDGEELETLKSLIAELQLQEQVDLTGFVENPLIHFRNSDLFVLCSRWEGLPTVLIEAIGQGMKSISQDISEGPEEIISNNKFGFLSTATSEEEFCRDIVHALDTDLEFDVSEFRKRFSTEDRAKDYLELI